jgi:hypothetical protein
MRHSAPAAVPQVEDQVAQKADMRVLDIDYNKYKSMGK